MTNWITRRVIDNPTPFNLWLLGLSQRWDQVKLWLESLWYFRQNAKVIEDFEERMSAIICAASGQMMSKPYYTSEAMLAEITRYHDSLYSDGYNEAIDDALGVISQEGDENMIRDILEMKVEPD